MECMVAFLDLKNAFGSVKHNLIGAALKWYNVSETMINLFKSLYTNCAVTVVTPNWKTDAIGIEIGSLQGGPEAGVLFNVPWNLVIQTLIEGTKEMKMDIEKKPISGFADDLTIKTKSKEQMEEMLKIAEKCCRWSKCLMFKESKSLIVARKGNGKIYDPKLKMNKKIVPAMGNKPFKFLGKWIYPPLNEVEAKKALITKYENLMKATDKVKIDGKKKTWIYQFGVLPAIGWECMTIEVDETTVKTMEATTNRYIKKWLKLAKCANTSVLYREICGLKIENIRNFIISRRCNTEIILAGSRDPVVRAVAKRRRDIAEEKKGLNIAKKIKTAVNEIEFKMKFMQNTRTVKDKKGLRVRQQKEKIKLDKKEIIKTVRKMTDDERLAKILQLAKQSKWTKWEDLINVDIKWKEMLYAYSPSMISFLINSIQDTLPDPVNIRRWTSAVEAKCALCGWKNCTQQHILCGCKVALEQGRVSFRHDSILVAMEKWIKRSKVRHEMKGNKKSKMEGARKEIKFVREGVKPPKAKKTKSTFWDGTDDWKILVDKRKNQYQMPHEIVASTLRPDILIYSLKIKKCLFLELTSPFEDNIEDWKMKKRKKYMKLAQEAGDNGWTAAVRTVEVGARGFVSCQSMGIFNQMGLSSMDVNKARNEFSKVALRTSHFIWISRNNMDWIPPFRAVEG